MAWKRLETLYFLIDSYLKDSAFTAVKKEGVPFSWKMVCK